MVASWDQQRFLASLGPMQAMAAVFLQTFLQTVQQNLSQIEQAQQQQDHRAIHRVAHSIKGSAGQIHCVKLAAIAADLEACTSGESMPIDTAVEALINQASLDRAAIELFLSMLRP